MPQAKSPQGKGPLWETFKKMYIGRKVKKDGREGVVMYKVLMYAPSHHGAEKEAPEIYMVCWDFDSFSGGKLSDTEEVAVDQLRGWALEEFHQRIVDDTLWRLQQANWHPFDGYDMEMENLKIPKRPDGQVDDGTGDGDEGIDGDGYGRGDNDDEDDEDDNDDEDDFQKPKTKSRGRPARSSGRAKTTQPKKSTKRKAPEPADSDVEVVESDDEAQDDVEEEEQNNSDEDEPAAKPGRSRGRKPKTPKTSEAPSQKTPKKSEGPAKKTPKTSEEPSKKTPKKSEGPSKKIASAAKQPAPVKASPKKATPPPKQPTFVTTQTGRQIPYEQCYKPGDERLSDRKDEEEEDLDKEYVFDRILDERETNGEVEYLLKWKGYELDVNKDWVPAEEMENTAALKKWRTAQKGPASASKSGGKTRSKAK